MPPSSVTSLVAVIRAALAPEATWKERAAVGDLFRASLPPGIPARLISKVWAQCIPHPNIYSCMRRVTDGYVDAVVAGLKKRRAPAATFFVAAAGKRPTLAKLKAANSAFLGLEPPEPYTPKGRARILAVMAQPSFRAAAQAAVRRRARASRRW
jgi:hypothetical protein